ncbi:MAG: diguanylate cyclase [Nitrospirae bacterium]|jgi:diguanylate cyclase (GGDEF)-like protein/PAS domain S-box-containing protein|nr:diguanylate cyclase [Nitrospirota bacterium]
MELDNVSTIMSRDVITLSPDETLLSAIIKMNKNNVSCIVIVKDNKPEGILTERDIIYLKGNNVDFNLVNLKTVMKSPVIAVSEDTDIPEIANLMVINGLRRLVVVDNNHKVTGIVTQTDIIKNLRIDSFVNLKKVEQIMNRSIISVSEEEPLTRVISLMAENKISCIVVKKNSKPIGIITERNITKAIAENISPSCISEIMETKLITASKDINLYEATRLIDENMVRCLIITDDEGDSIGIITKSDIIKNLRADYITILKNMLRQKSRALIESELKYRTLVEQSLEGIMIIQDGIIKFINPTLLKILDYYQKDMLGEDILRFLYPDSRSLFSENLKKLESNKSLDSPLEIRMLSKNNKGLYMEVLLTQIPYEGKPAVLLTLRDITERKKTEAELKRLVITDDLTGLFNQRYFYTIILKEIERAKRHNRRLSLMLIDIDFFKDFNDRYGHWEGDFVLKKIADVISKNIRDIDMAFRYGGEEFTILLPETAYDEAILVAERIRKSVSETVFHPFTLDGELEIVTKTVSIGLTELNPYDDMKSFVVRADNAMYQAKKSGRNKIVHLL